MAGALLSTTALAAQLLPDIDAVNVQVNEGCSGTLIDRSGLILTANHCVTDQYSYIERETINADGEVIRKKVRILADGSATQYQFDGAASVKTIVYKTKLLATDKGIDLALMQIITPLPASQVTARFACSPLQRGDIVAIVGNPMGLLYSSLVVGVTSSTQRTYQLLGSLDGAADAPLDQISGGVIGGNSGGSVWNVNGQLVGVPVLAHRVNEVLGFSVPLGSIRTFLTAQGLDRLFEHCGK